jgi:A/G-specific adenine glycosylase
VTERTVVGPIEPSRRRFFSGQLLSWGADNQRRFPWREERDPFRVLVAEVLLQRSRSRTVVPVYEELFELWPTPADLARAPVRQIEAVIRPLGLLRRAARLKLLAARIDELGSVPSSATELEALPGVGRYAAGVALATMRDRATAPVDSVSARVYRRYFGSEARVEPSEDVGLWELVARVVPAHRARDVNWAVLDIAATVCLPRNPRCATCPLEPRCRWAEDNG